MVGNVSSIGPSSERVFIEPNKITEINTVYMGNGPDAHISVNPKGTRERVGDLTSENTLSLGHLIIHLFPTYGISI